MLEERAWERKKVYEWLIGRERERERLVGIRKLKQERKGQERELQRIIIRQKNRI